jgi:hypothetical protein
MYDISSKSVEIGKILPYKRTPNVYLCTSAQAEGPPYRASSGHAARSRDEGESGPMTRIILISSVTGSTPSPTRVGMRPLAASSWSTSPRSSDTQKRCLRHLSISCSRPHSRPPRHPRTYGVGRRQLLLLSRLHAPTRRRGACPHQRDPILEDDKAAVSSACKPRQSLQPEATRAGR